MGVYLNPKNDSFEESVNSDIYVDKSELIRFTDTKLRKSGKYICAAKTVKFDTVTTPNIITTDNKIDKDLLKNFFIKFNLLLKTLKYLYNLSEFELCYKYYTQLLSKSQYKIHESVK